MPPAPRLRSVTVLLGLCLAPALAWAQPEALPATLDRARVLMLLYGMIIAVAIGVLLFWVSLRERALLRYSGFLASQGLMLMAASGELVAVPGLRWLSGGLGTGLFAGLALFAGVHFLADFAHLGQRLPRLTRGLRISALITVGLLVACPWLPHLHLWHGVGAVAALMLLLAVLVALWQVGATEPGLRRYSLAAWLPFALALSTLVVHAGLDRPLAPALDYLLTLSIALAGMAVLTRLARRMDTLRNERDHARAEAERVRHDSERDALTGAFNRASWSRRLDAAAVPPLVGHPHKPLSVLFFDIDLFKLINDSLGHGVGDDCLRAVSRTVSEELRGGDVLGRLGGEEFAVILPGARRIHAIAVAERIRTAVQARCQVVGEEVVELTVSIGAAEWLGAGERPEALLERADRAMYLAKDSGRNMVVADPQGLSIN